MTVKAVPSYIIYFISSFWILGIGKAARKCLYYGMCSQINIWFTVATLPQTEISPIDPVFKHLYGLVRSRRALSDW